jgi:hypothetical protein
MWLAGRILIGLHVMVTLSPRSPEPMVTEARLGQMVTQPTVTPRPSGSRPLRSVTAETPVRWYPTSECSLCARLGAFEETCAAPSTPAGHVMAPVVTPRGAGAVASSSELNCPLTARNGF